MPPIGVFVTVVIAPVQSSYWQRNEPDRELMERMGNDQMGGEWRNFFLPPVSAQGSATDAQESRMAWKVNEETESRSDEEFGGRRTEAPV